MWMQINVITQMLLIKSDLRRLTDLHLLPELRHEIAVVLELVLHRGAFVFGAVFLSALAIFGVLHFRFCPLGILFFLLLFKLFLDLYST